MWDWLADTLLLRSRMRRHREIIARQPLFHSDIFYNQVRWRLFTLDAAPLPRAAFRHCLFSIEPDGLHIYPVTRQMEQHLLLPPDALRWFGRPHKYQPGKNVIWLHLEQDGRWLLLHLETERHAMQKLVRALKQIATPQQVNAYRRQRPYMHLGPLTTQAAEQDLYGVWTVFPPLLALYLTPAMLVLLENGRVRRALPLEHVQQIEAMRRLDDPTAPGVVRFRYDAADGQAIPERLAYTLPEYAEFAAALAEAAKRTLETPPVFYGKKKADEEDEDA